MKRVLLTIVLCFAVLIAGCAALDGLLLSPDGSVNDTVGTIVGGVEAGGAAVGAVGVPYGYVVSGIASAIAGLFGTYATMRKKQKAADNKTQEYQAVLSAVVAAVEDLKDVQVKPEGPTAEEMVKEYVKKHLEEKDIYALGKVLIDLIKAGEVK